ncbi:uncharacterized protein LOC117173416 [Belonocnema kinseyi]|uniref:uncharacterized protein LOC117173416 n=1 Tax=Belonocnema kinseyi TaxID=2817044 RepID=UPI00143D9BB6|nr:uncharacterized protein LOC117173416 [Belonocnema kinseyi]
MIAVLKQCFEDRLAKQNLPALQYKKELRRIGHYLGAHCKSIRSRMYPEAVKSPYFNKDREARSHQHDDYKHVDPSATLALTTESVKDWVYQYKNRLKREGKNAKKAQEREKYMQLDLEEDDEEDDS